VALISGAGFPALLLRPFVFGAVFFVFAGGIRLLINRFIPDLLNAGEEEDGSAPGSLVDISVGDENAPQRISAALPGFDSEEVGNIGELLETEPGSGNSAGAGGSSVSGLPDPETAGAEIPGLDHNRQDGYTAKGKGAAGNSGNSAVPDVLPDLDSMAGVFLSKSEDSGSGISGVAGMPVSGAPGPDEAGGAGSVPEERRPKSSGKGQSMGGDYNPKDLASAMRTILSKD
jgi:hypothetical protein